MIAAICIALLALAAWSLVALDLGRRAIALESEREKRRSSDAALAGLASHEARISRLEKADRDVAKVMGGRR